MKTIKKTKAKRLLSLLLVLVMILSAMPLSGISAFAATSGDFEYEILEDGTAEIIWYSGTETDLVIPSEIDGHKVTSIGMSAFYSGSGENFKSVYIPEGVVKIGSQAFDNCQNLEEIKLPDTLETIEHSAFNNCSSLTTITIPKNVDSIGFSAFYGCSALTEINVDEDNKLYNDIDGVLCMFINDTYNWLAYYPDGKHDEHYVVPDEIQVIDKYAFGNNEYIKDIYFSDSIVSIDSEAFLGSLPNLSNIFVSESNENYCAVDGVLFNKDQTWLMKYPEGKNYANYEIVESVTDISAEAFKNARNLKNVVISGNVTSLEQNTFSGCTSLENIEIPNSVSSIRMDVFSDCTSLKTVDLPETLKELESGAFRGCASLESIDIPATISSIRMSVFMGCSSLKEVNIKGIVTTIENYAFDSCTSLEKFYFPYGIQEIGEGAFFECSNLESVIIPDSVEYIGDFAFWNSIAPTKIYGYAGTEAERYAKAYNQEFIALDKKVDESTGILVFENELNIIPDEAQLKAEQLSSEENKIVFDISLVKDGTAVQPNGEVTVKIPVPEGMDTSLIKVYREEDDGTLTDMKAYFVNGCMVFVTDHFSKYVLAYEESSTDLKGDINGDGKVTAIDARWVLQIAAGIRQVTEEEKAAVDFNKDGKVTAIDARWVLQAAAGIREL